MALHFILIVDDEANQRFMLEQALCSLSANWTISTVATGQEALDFVALHTPDLIITDYYMPVMNGINLITQMRQRGLCCPIIMITAYMSPQVAEAARLLAVTHCLTKPVPLTQVRRLAHAALTYHCPLV